jgi:hypothetical protein
VREKPMSIEVAGGLLLIDDQHEWARGGSRLLEGFGRHPLIVGARGCDPQASSTPHHIEKGAGVSFLNEGFFSLLSSRLHWIRRRPCQPAFNLLKGDRVCGRRFADSPRLTPSRSRPVRSMGRCEIAARSVPPLHTAIPPRPRLRDGCLDISERHTADSNGHTVN